MINQLQTLYESFDFLAEIGQLQKKTGPKFVGEKRGCAARIFWRPKVESGENFRFFLFHSKSGANVLETTLDALESPQRVVCGAV